MQQIQVQAIQDPACSDWLDNTPDGQAFVACQNITDAMPSRNSKNNCSLTNADYDAFCNNSCYPILMNGYNHILSGPCLAMFEELFTCGNDTDCDGGLCYEGNCYTSCKSNSDCNGCYETCASLAARNQTVCLTQYATVPTSSNFRGTVASLNSYCVKDPNPTGVGYCSTLLNYLLHPNMSQIQCFQVASWGCCLGSILQTDQYCEYRTWNNTAIYGCGNSNSVCSSLPSPQAFCAANSTLSIGTGSSSIISSLIGSLVNSTSGINGSSPVSITIGVPGGSSVSVGINPNGTIGTGSGGNGAGKENAPWLLVLGLMCTLLFSSN
jgi:hypothetical protein